jgi:hypothetical protein
VPLLFGAPFPVWRVLNILLDVISDHLAMVVLLMFDTIAGSLAQEVWIYEL